MPFQYDEVESAIVGRLQQKITASSLNIDVVQLPEKDNDEQPAIDRPLLTVYFAGSSAKQQKSTSDAAHDEELTIIVNIQSKWLRGANGCHTAERHVRGFLLGWQPPHCGRLYFKSYQPSNPERLADEARWFWDLEFTVIKATAQAFRDDITGDESIFEDYGITIITPCLNG